ncbi:DUF4132 domain-containing protein [Actinoalloteichus hymeniacidonis]|uniref:DUF4132 family protein n=1 Tax=Actinoalloteichus hymeniacidonis TaxID=340345 RepID=A0AAC9HRL8_9PSEU|nr:DUF4132 domain-containing protein [Actinoalloteichus hymeniacidonis]AOS64158.1 putative DUF4132 family protein [Actinoalloteichus hymeniacidonis]MBB5907775.1 hypothetical protein [Actinoalloteichus hymeniacidonis]
MVTAGLTATNEDSFVVPESWAARIDPWRHSRVESAVEPDRGARAKVRRLLTKAESALTEALTGEHGSEDVAAAGRAHLADEPTPLGAAAVFAVVAATADVKRLDSLAAFADVWAKDHGLVFTATAVAELAGIEHVAGTGRRSLDPQVPRHLRRRDSDTRQPFGWSGEQVARRVRALLSIASDADYLAAAQELVAYGPPADSPRHAADESEPVLDGSEMQRLVACYLTPTESDRIESVVQAPWLGLALAAQRGLVLRTVATAEHLTAVSSWGEVAIPTTAEDVFTLAERVGAGLLPVLETVLAALGSLAPLRARVYEVLAALPTDAAFDVLAAQLGTRHAYATVSAAARRFPLRALRRLPALAVDESTEADPTTRQAALVAAWLLHELLADPEFCAVDGAAELVTAARASVPRPTDWWPVAEDTSLPDFLASGSWLRDGPQTGPVEGELGAVAEEGACWAPGEREQWAAMPAETPWSGTPDWDEIGEAFQKRKLDSAWDIPVLVEAPERYTSGRLRYWYPETLPSDPAWLYRLAAARPESAAKNLWTVAKKSPPAEYLWALLPFRTVDITNVLMGGLLPDDPRRPVAEAYLRRHGATIVPYLLSGALSEDWRRRQQAREALRFVAELTSTEAVVEAAGSRGDAAGPIVEQLLRLRPLDEPAATIPTLGDWLDLGLLPQILLRDRSAALPRESVRALLTLVAIGGLYGDYSGLHLIRQACDPTSLSRFARALFEDWLAAHRPADTEWVLTVVGRFGDDAAATRLAGFLGFWVSSGSAGYGMAGFGALRTMDTDHTLRLVHSIAKTNKPASLARQAGWAIRADADRLGLTTEQFADRLVPDLGLSPNGTLELDYGPRRFIVGFDEQLKPFVTGEDGKSRKSLPKPGVRDDAELATSSYQRFTALKKSVRGIATEQVRRLEAALIVGRRWRWAEFETSLLRHPLLCQLVRRLVWVVERDGELIGTFRVAEDRSLADVEDAEFAVQPTAADDAGNTIGGRESNPGPIPADARVGIAHPLQLGELVKAWTDVFADYEILQPFPQLGRPVYERDTQEQDPTRLSAFNGRTAPTGRVLGLERTGWKLEGVEAGTRGSRISLVRQFGERGALIRISPGISVMGAPDPVQEITDVWLWTEGSKDKGWSTFTLADRIAWSELIGALTDLTAGAS